MPRPNPNVTDNMPKYVPADLPKDVLNSFATKSPRYQVALDDTSPPSERLAVDRLPVSYTHLTLPTIYSV